MIVCHCNRIDHREIEEACQGIEGRDGCTLLTPVAVYRELGKRPRCGGCLTLAANLIQDRRPLVCPGMHICPLAVSDPNVQKCMPDADVAYLDAAE